MRKRRQACGIVIGLAVAELESEDEMMHSEVEELESGLVFPTDHHRHLHRHGNWLPLRCYCGLWVE